MQDDECNCPTCKGTGKLPKSDWTQDVYILPNHRCNRCGLILGQVMGYVCPEVNCPVGLGGRTTC